MGIYDSYILPPLLHLAMRSPEAARQRRRIVPAARGRVLELGIGSGLNLPFYGAGVASLAGLDPSAPLLARARRAALSVPFEVELHQAAAEALPFEAASFDSLVMTWTLCSVADARRVLAEARRVLRPGGELIFVEHGQAPEPGVSAWQDRITPWWRRCAGGCHLNRDIAGLIGSGGFSLSSLEVGYLVKGPRPMTYHYLGRARPR